MPDTCVTPTQHLRSLINTLRFGDLASPYVDAALNDLELETDAAGGWLGLGPVRPEDIPALASLQHLFAVRGLSLRRTETWSVRPKASYAYLERPGALVMTAAA